LNLIETLYQDVSYRVQALPPSRWFTRIFDEDSRPARPPSRGERLRDLQASVLPPCMQSIITALIPFVKPQCGRIRRGV